MAQLYAIVSHLERARFFLDCQVPYLQLRFKDHPLRALRAEVARICQQCGQTRVIINDDLALAQDVGAWGVHLGQEDLARHTPDQLAQTPVKLGISTHNAAEIRAAMAWHPALLGFGPVFPTISKTLAHPPQGLDTLGALVAQVPLPLVAIGGIHPGNLDAVVATGVAAIAMIAHLDTLTHPQQVADLMARLAAP